jgi:hypothetical protein
MTQFTQNDLFWLRQALEQAKAGLEQKARLGNAGAHLVCLTYLKLHEKVSQEIHANDPSPGAREALPREIVKTSWGRRWEH